MNENINQRSLPGFETDNMQQNLDGKWEEVPLLSSVNSGDVDESTITGIDPRQIPLKGIDGLDAYQSELEL